MSVRRQLISNELQYTHQTSPRKTRTQSGSPVIPTILYDSRMHSNDPKHWIGKTLIPWNGENMESYARLAALANSKTTVNESDVANYTKLIYRILYIDDRGYLKSKPSIDKVPARLNLFLTTDNIIRHVAY